MLLGEHEHALDDKNRVTLPARFRQAFADGVFVTKGFDPCLLVYPPDGWSRFVEGQLGGLTPFSREARQMSRYVFASAIQTDLDKQGRMGLTPPLLAARRPRARRDRGGRPGSPRALGARGLAPRGRRRRREG